jgi:hypothetical protein
MGDVIYVEFSGSYRGKIIETEGYESTIVEDGFLSEEDDDYYAEISESDFEIILNNLY